MPITPPPGGFVGPVKRSVTIAGHETSISLEPVFWQALEAAAGKRGLPLNALVAAVDALRIEAEAPPNLASALRTWLLGEVGEMGSGKTSQSSPGGGGGRPAEPVVEG